MPRRTTSERTSTSSRYSPIHVEGEFSPRADHDFSEEEEFFLFVLECDEFWWDEEEKHELF